MKVVLSIAGSDSSGGAGIQADLKTFEAFGVFGTTAITVLTAQNTTGVQQIVPVDVSFVKKQIEMVFEDFDVAAIKIGMLYNKEIIEMVADVIKDFNIPIVLDPVSISKAGSPLLEDDAIKAMHELFAHVTVITPNQHEAYEFFGYKQGDKKSLQVIQELNTPVLVKHHVVELAEGSFSSDQLFFGHHKRIFQSPLIESSNLRSLYFIPSSSTAIGHSFFARS